MPPTRTVGTHGDSGPFLPSISGAMRVCDSQLPSHLAPCCSPPYSAQSIHNSSGSPTESVYSLLVFFPPSLAYAWPSPSWQTSLLPLPNQCQSHQSGQLRSHTLRVDTPLLTGMVFRCSVTCSLLSFHISVCASLSFVHGCVGHQSLEASPGHPQRRALSPPYRHRPPDTAPEPGGGPGGESASIPVLQCNFKTI